MGRLYQRRVVLYVDTVRIDGLHTEFRVEKSTRKEPNSADISVANLSESSRAGMAAAGAAVVLMAGYADSVHQIFSGSARTIDHVHPQAEWITRVKCGDGERAFQFARVNASFRGNTAVSTVLSAVGDALKAHGVQSGNLIKQVAGIQDQFTQGYTAQGSAAAELDRLLVPRGYEWSIQDGQLQVVKVGEPASASAVLLSPSTGLVGSPEHASPDKKHRKILKARSLLNGALVPGGLVQVQSLATKGLFRIEKVTHSGDTDGNDFYSDIEATAAS